MNLYPAASYLRHFFKARSTAGYGVHSPFMFEFLEKVVRGKSSPSIIESVEELRREMLGDKRIIKIRDLGTGPSWKKTDERVISDIAAKSALPAREAGLLARVSGELRLKNYELRNSGHGASASGRTSGGMERGAWGMEHGAWSTERGAWGMEHGAWSMERGARVTQDGSIRQLTDKSEHQARTRKQGEGSLDKKDRQNGIILELGTSLGISTLALALAAPERKIVSVEGCPALAAVARENLDRHGAGNASVLNMEFDDALKVFREKGIKVSLAYIDGNHRGDALKHYVNAIREMGEEMIIIADDIHLNSDMYRAWRSITKSGSAPVTLETFRLGLIFFMKKLTPGNYRIWY